MSARCYLVSQSLRKRFQFSNNYFMNKGESNNNCNYSSSQAKPNHNMPVLFQLGKRESFNQTVTLLKSEKYKAEAKAQVHWHYILLLAIWNGMQRRLYCISEVEGELFQWKPYKVQTLSKMSFPCGASFPLMIKPNLCMRASITTMTSHIFIFITITAKVSKRIFTPHIQHSAIRHIIIMRDCKPHQRSRKRHRRTMNPTQFQLQLTSFLPSLFIISPYGWVAIAITFILRNNNNH